MRNTNYNWRDAGNVENLVAELAKCGKRMPDFAMHDATPKLRAASGELKRCIKALQIAPTNENTVRAMETASGMIDEIAGLTDTRDGFGASMAAGDSNGAQAWNQFQEHRDLYDRTNSVRFTIKGAATDPATTATTRSIVSDGVGYPNGPAVGLQNAFSQRTVDGNPVIEYSRYSSTEGAAAVQSAEGDAKAAVAPRFTLISTKPITVAGYCKVSTQALASQWEVQRAIDVTLRRSIETVKDDVLTAGSGAAFAGMESLATAYTSLVYQRHADAVSEGVSTMQQAGFNPDVVAFNPADWLAVQTLQTATEKLYLSGSYLGEQPQTLRGLRVVVSPGLTAGASLLLDSSQCELIVCDGMTVQVGLNSDDFTRNLRTILAEVRFVPTFRAVGAARLITPKA